MITAQEESLRTLVDVIILSNSLSIPKIRGRPSRGIPDSESVQFLLQKPVDSSLINKKAGTLTQTIISC